MDMEKWEYTTLLIHASLEDKGVKEYLAKRYPGWKPAKYAPESLDVYLNKLGEQGWEMVTMQPVAGVGANRDIQFAGYSDMYSSAFFCVLKRRIA